MSRDVLAASVWTCRSVGSEVAILNRQSIQVLRSAIPTPAFRWRLGSEQHAWTARTGHAATAGVMAAARV